MIVPIANTNLGRI